MLQGQALARILGIASNIEEERLGESVMVDEHDVQKRFAKKTLLQYIIVYIIDESPKILSHKVHLFLLQ